MSHNLCAVCGLYHHHVIPCKRAREMNLASQKKLQCANCGEYVTMLTVPDELCRDCNAEKESVETYPVMGSLAEFIRLAAAEIAAIREMHSQGYTVDKAYRYFKMHRANGRKIDERRLSGPKGEQLRRAKLAQVKRVNDSSRDKAAKHGQQWTTAEDNKLIEMVNAGKSNLEIGIELGRTMIAVQNRITKQRLIITASESMNPHRAKKETEK